MLPTLGSLFGSGNNSGTSSADASTTDTAAKVEAPLKGPTPGFRPLLDGVPGSNAGAAGLTAAVDDILNGGAATAAVVLPFEYVMPRGSPREFLKRVSGELGWNSNRGTFSIRVGDVDRNWLTTDQCADLDVTFQVTLETGSVNIGSTKAFPVTTVKVTATDGMADVKVPASLGQTGTPVAVSVTSVVARACGTTKPPPVDCTHWQETIEQLWTTNGQIKKKSDQLWERLLPAETALADLRKILTENPDDMTAARVHVQSFLAVVSLLDTEVSAPVFVAKLAWDLVESAENIYQWEVKASDLLKWIGTAIEDKIGDRIEVFYAILRELQYGGSSTPLTRLRESARELSAQIAAYKGRLAQSKAIVDSNWSRIDELRDACGVPK